MNKTHAGFLISALVFLLAACTEAPENSARQAEQWADKTLAGLTLEKKVAQLLCTDITGSYIPEDDPRFANWLKLAGEYGIGGFVLYGGTPHEAALLINRLQKEAQIPLLISADFEGGPGQQVTGASEFPGNMAFAAARDEDLMYRAARIMAAEGRAMGIHLTYTPVTDVSLSPDNPQESVRSFGGDINLNGKLLKAYVRGYHEIGMLTTAKHFPGRGDMKAFPDFPGFNYLDKSAAEVEQNEFTAFQYAVDAGVDFIMTEHVAVPSVTGGSGLPASVEKKLIKGIIRNKLGFQGIITSDDLWYDHVTARFGKEDVAVKALEAGHDIVLKPKDPVAAIAAIVAAVKEGRIPEEQINGSVRKLLVKKAQLGLQLNKFIELDEVDKVVGIRDHLKVVQEVADRSLTLLRNDGVLPLKTFDPKKTVHITIQKTDDQPAVRDLVLKMAGSFVGLNTFSLRPGLAESYYRAVEKATLEADLVILSFLVQRDRSGDPAPLRTEDQELIRKIVAARPNRVIAMSFGNPHIIRKTGTISAFLVGYGETGWYGNQPVYFDSFIRLLKGELIPTGKLPIEVSADYLVGFGLTY
jgi:beta-N-acetylhexosaminidase